MPIEDTVGEMARLKEEGKVRFLGLSRSGAADDPRARMRRHPITAVQTELSLWSRDAEAEVLPTVRELGIGYVAYSPLGRGFLTGQFKSPDDFPEDDFRKNHPRFQGENFEKNLELVREVEAMAEEKGCTTAQLALAWVLAQGEDIVPIPGTKHVRYLDENIGALEVKLTRRDLQAARRDPAAGRRRRRQRYPRSGGMAGRSTASSRTRSYPPCWRIHSANRSGQREPGLSRRQVQAEAVAALGEQMRFDRCVFARRQASIQCRLLSMCTRPSSNAATTKLGGVARGDVERRRARGDQLGAGIGPEQVGARAAV